MVVTAKLAIDLHLPDAVPFAYLNATVLRWPVHGRILFASGVRRHGFHVGHFRLLRFGRAQVSEEHHGANEIFRVIVGFAVVSFVPGHTHRFDEPCSQMIDKPRLGASHECDWGLQHRLMGQHTSFEIGCLG
ncbi:MAG: hypothetical protein RIE24_02640 [Silicimonas sp.]